MSISSLRQSVGTINFATKLGRSSLHVLAVPRGPLLGGSTSYTADSEEDEGNGLIAAQNCCKFYALSVELEACQDIADCSCSGEYDEITKECYVTCKVGDDSTAPIAYGGCVPNS